MSQYVWQLVALWWNASACVCVLLGYNDALLLIAVESTVAELASECCSNKMCFQSSQTDRRPCWLKLCLPRNQLW